MKDNSYFWRGEKIFLRPFYKEDWKEWIEDFEDSSAIRMLEWGVELPKSDEMAKKQYEQWADFQGKENRIMFAIVTIEGELVGGINISGVDVKNGLFSFGIRVNRKFRKMGYGSEAARIILRYGFYEMRLQKCNSGCLHINEGSIKMHKNLGFVEEGRQRRMAYTNGQYFDNIVFGLTKEDFDENEKGYFLGPIENTRI